MINAMTALYNKLVTFDPKISFEYAPDGTVYPYSVYQLDSPLTTFKTQISELTINVWHDRSLPDAYTEIEELRDSIWKGLDNYTYSSANTTLSVRQLSNLVIPDETPNIIRRELTFQVLIEEV